MEEFMTFDEIITKITLGLKNEAKEDIKYLMEQMDEYKDHEYSKEIHRAIGRIIYEICPDDMKSEFKKIMEHNNLGIDKILEEADFQMYKGSFSKALQIMETLINNIEERNWYQDDEKSEYHCFNNILEEILYKELFKPTKDLRQIPENYTDVYLKYGIILFELKEYNKSKEVLEKANKYNPINVRILFELSEIHKMNKNWEEYIKINNKCLEYSYSSKDIARCYRNYGFYFIEQKDYNMAINLFYLSLDFDQENKTAQSELLYISEKTGIKIKQPKSDEIIELLKDKNIQIGANNLVISIAHYIGKEALKNKNVYMSKYFTEIVYDLTKDEDFKKTIENLNSLIEKLEEATGT
jgi:tetratricopeptide (TPR) repeat protein